MRIIVDTSVLIRFLTRDDAVRAAKAKSLLEKEKNLFIPEAVFPEIEYILRKTQRPARETIAHAFSSIAALDNITFTQQTGTAIALYAKSRLDMADCLIAAHSFKGKLASFDKELLAVEAVRAYWEKV